MRERAAQDLTNADTRAQRLAGTFSADHLLLWAKTVPGTDRYHPLGHHSLDVAAVAERLIERDARRFGRLADQLGVSAAALRRLTVWLVAMHDIGKASRVFQLKASPVRIETRPGTLERLLGLSQEAVSGPSHGPLTAWYLSRGEIAGLLESLTPGWFHGFRARLVEAVAGHHGRPVATGDIVDVKGIVGRPLIPVAEALAREMAEVIGAGPVAPVSAIGQPAAIADAWYIATLLPLSDWLGSNLAWFEPTNPVLDLPAYWSGRAQPLARTAIAASGIGAGRPSRPDAALILPAGGTASPVQAWAESVAIPAEGPMLAIVEDATGSGKTEAALILVHRLMHAGLASGFYLALPTMATANAMFERLGLLYRGMFEPDTEPSLSLAHGRAKRNAEFLASIGQRPAGQVRGEESVYRYCNGWIADDRRKAFFAQSGAGTIDQAVLSVLPSKYQTLRLRGLADKVLVLDEVHAYDAYLSAEVEGLLRFHAAQGGSAVILSATLPLKTRARLLTAFAEGAGRPVPAPAASAYPLATTVMGTRFAETPLATRPGNDRVVRIERVATVAAAEALAGGFAGAGAAVALIRSTVDAAIESFDRLSAAAPAGVEVDLFHARFLPSDRDAIERRVMRRFGKDAGGAERRNSILVATQVIEQSLDLDFDVIVTDLAPVDSNCR
ncbi:MAG: CRISPR-associated helicase Cas3' [Bauldia sp.]